MRLARLLVMVAGVSFVASAQVTETAVPEIGAGSATSALVLLGGAILVIRGRRK
mgnify:CR=1 FL=1